LSRFLSDNVNGEDSSQGRKSSKTINSIVKFSKEPLHVGKSLGVKVIDKEEVTLERITRSLKRDRKALTKPKTN